MKFRFLTTLLLSLAFIGAMAQQVTISGVVTDAKDGSPIPGVNVIIKGTSKGTVTSLDGNYTMTADAGSVLVFSFIGYVNQEITVTATGTKLNITLSEAVTGLDEVVVIGYGTVKKSDATGSVAVVSSKEFNKGAITSAQDLIVGKTAGVVITTNGGAPGGETKIRVRGGSSLNANNDPLIVIDGVPINNTEIKGQSNSLASLNPNDIETFSVLKDASATAIYGSRASNGVIIITTKKGKVGALKVNYSNNTSISTIPAYLDVLSGDEFRQLATQRAAMKVGLDTSTLKLLGKENTDWQKQIYQTALNMEHNLSVSGSIGKVPYRVSGGYTNQEGILKNTAMNRKTITVAIDPSLFKDHLKINLNVKGMSTDNNFGNTGAIGAAIAYDPTKPVMNGNTTYGGYTTWINSGELNPDGTVNINGGANVIATSNPVAMVNQTDNKATVNRSIGNAQFDYKFHFLPELRANLNVGYDFSSSDGHNKSDTTAAFTFRNGKGKKETYTQTLKNELLDFYLNYVKDLSGINSKIDLTGGYSWQYFYNENQNINSVLVPYKPDTTGSITEYYLVSFFGRLNYTFMDKYLITATFRNDGSSRFSPDTRWGLFPSFAFGWKMKEENFLKNVDLISEMKLRLGYGVTGQQDLGYTLYDIYPYIPNYLRSYSTARVKFGDEFVYTQRPNPYDSKIKWEETSTTNIALDYGLFKNRVSGSIEYYFRKTKDLLGTIPIPAGTNFANYMKTNVGNLENKGVEFSINGAIISQKDYFWEVGYNISYNENKITKLLKVEDPSYIGIPDGDISGGVGNKIQIKSVNYPANSFFVFQQVYHQNGMPAEGVYVNRSGQSGKVISNNLNKYRYKKPSPDYTMGISTRGNIKKFDFSASSRILIGNYAYNNIAANRANYASLYISQHFSNLPKSINDTKFNDPQYWSDYYVENASFFKLDNISAGYNFDKLVSNKISGRLGFAVQNVFTITKYSGLDPEVDNGIDNNVYPRPRTFLLSLNLNF